MSALDSIFTFSKTHLAMTDSLMTYGDTLLSVSLMATEREHIPRTKQTMMLKRPCEWRVPLGKHLMITPVKRNVGVVVLSIPSGGGRFMILLVSPEEMTTQIWPTP